MLKLRIFNTKIPQELESVHISPETSKKNDFLIGRAPYCDVPLSNPTVSREHCKISFLDDQYYFTDLGSTNGSQINNIAREALKAVRLAVNDTIQLGDFTLLVEEITIYSQLDNLFEEEEEPTEPSIAHLYPSVTTEMSSGDRSSDRAVDIVASIVEASVNSSQYMPLAVLSPHEIPRWTKGNLTLKCVNIIAETTDVKTFSFVTTPPHLFTYKAGQFITLETAIDGVEVSRSYSISSTPSRPHSLEITVKQVPSLNPEDFTIFEDLMSNWLHNNFNVGSQIRASGAFGNFTCFDYPSQKLLFLSAGSGITPMMSMSRWIYDTHSDCDVVFFHCARSPQDIIYKQELELMAARSPKFHLAITVTRPTVQQPWIGLRGRLTTAMLEMIAPDWRDRTVFVHGPEGFMQSTKSLLEGMGFPMQQYHEEDFDETENSSNSSQSKDELLAT